MVKEGEIIEVTWLDANGCMKAEIKDIENLEPENLLVTTKTYGVLYKQSDLAIIILQEVSESECDYTVVAKSDIINIKILK
jgi:hypothetical protein